jgi:hypothetical protein
MASYHYPPFVKCELLCPPFDFFIADTAAGWINTGRDEDLLENTTRKSNAA